MREKKQLPNIENPCPDQVECYLQLWDKQENYKLQEKALDKLFFNTYPNNTDINDILIKASSLNDFYSTNIYSIFSVAKHISELNIDSRLASEDLSLVDDIATVVINGKQLRFYSFASKYCSHHMPNVFPIIVVGTIWLLGIEFYYQLIVVYTHLINLHNQSSENCNYKKGEAYTIILINLLNCRKICAHKR